MCSDSGRVADRCVCQILAVVLAEATSLDLEEYRRFADTCGSVDQIRLLLSHVHMAQVSRHPAQLGTQHGPVVITQHGPVVMCIFCA